LLRSGRYRQRPAPAQTPLALKGLVLILLACVAVRAVAALGGEAASRDFAARFVSDHSVVESILEFEMGTGVKNDAGVNLISLVLSPSLYGGVTDETVQPPADSSPSLSDVPSPSGENAGDAAPETDDYWLFYENWVKPSESPSPMPNVITKPTQPTSAENIAVNNKTEYAVDTDALLKEPLKLKLTEDKPAVLIVHTHGSEAYLPHGTDTYVPSDPFRTQDKSQSVIRVGEELAAAFENAGISVIHDTGVYDYPSYAGAYNRSYDAIQSYLKKYPSIKVVIDLHRDAIGTEDTVYKTIAHFGDTTCSQLFFVIGTNASGLKHPNWRENLKLALHMQREMNRLYPTLAKPIELSQYRYNQQATLGSMLVEIGCTGNTLQESLIAARYFADAASRVLLGLY